MKSFLLGLLIATAGCFILYWIGRAIQFFFFPQEEHSVILLIVAMGTSLGLLIGVVEERRRK